jgi:hypothetical protein
MIPKNQRVTRSIRHPFVLDCRSQFDFLGFFVIRLISSPNKPKAAMKIMYIQIENGSFTKKHWNINYIMFFTVYRKEDFELQEAPHKLPAHLRYRRSARNFTALFTTLTLIPFPKKHKEATILKNIQILFS